MAKRSLLSERPSYLYEYMKIHVFKNIYKILTVFVVKITLDYIYIITMISSSPMGLLWL